MTTPANDTAQARASAEKKIGEPPIRQAQSNRCAIHEIDEFSSNPMQCWEMRYEKKQQKARMPPMDA